MHVFNPQLLLILTLSASGEIGWPLLCWPWWLVVTYQNGLWICPPRVYRYSTDQVWCAVTAGVTLLVCTMLLPLIQTILHCSDDRETTYEGLLLNHLVGCCDRIPAWDGMTWLVLHSASTVFAVVMWRSLHISACLSVRLSQVGIPLKRLNTGSQKQCHTIAQGL